MLRPLFTGEKSLLVIETLHRRKVDPVTPVYRSPTPLRDPRKRFALSSSTDINRAQAGRGRASRERGKISHCHQRSTTDVIYEWDLKESITGCGTWMACSGIRLEYSEDSRRLGSPLHPGTKNAVWMAVEKQLKGAAPYDVEYRIQANYGVCTGGRLVGTVIQERAR